MQGFTSSRRTALAFACTFASVAAMGPAFGQSTAGSLSGMVKDPSGAVVPGATVTIANPVSGYTRTIQTDAAGEFRFFNLPFNPYTVTVTSSSFVASSQRVDVESGLPITLAVSLQLGGANTSVTVEAAPDLVENDPHFHTDIDRSTIDRLPVESPTSELSSIVTELSPGVAADSNGLLHGLGDHNEVSFSIDGQPITDQQSKVFSNQVPAAAIQSLEVIEGAPPAEYGDKTSLVIVGTTRSGQGVMRPTGQVSVSYGSFGTANVSADLAYGGKNWGNFFAGNALESGRFLDAPEFAVYHDKGNEANLFDRIDRQLSATSTLHTNLQYTRSWFQTPNTYDTQYGYSQGETLLGNTGPTVLTSGKTDQRSKIQTFDISPTYTKTIGDTTIINFAPYVRRDGYNYYPSNNPLNDFGPIQGESVAQQRSLLNAGAHADVSYVKGHNNYKIGGMYEQTFLRENDQIGIVDPNLNADPTTSFFNTLAPYDLTTGGTFYHYHGQTDVKQIALYGEDSIKAGNWLFGFGIRGDFYNGLSIQRQAEPRAAISYSVKKTGTVLRVSYARTQETPFNENLVLSSQGCLDPVVAALFTTEYGFCTPAPFNPGFRNEFHAGFSQSISKHFVLSADYITKYTHNGYDFSVLGATPITFPIEWHNSKIPGYTASGTLTEVKGLTARITLSSVTARFFNPQIGGVGATVAQPGGFPFRIDHDERFNQTTHVEYKMPFRKSLYYSFNWKYDSGLVAGAAPCYNATDPNSACAVNGAGFTFNPTTGAANTQNGQPLINLVNGGITTADEEFQAGLACNGVKATATSGFATCLASQLTSKLVTIPGAGTEDDDKNPQRITPRNLFDMELGDDNVKHFGADNRYQLGARITAINLTDKYALYNFLSTFSGTHYVTPRTVTGEIALHF